MSVMFVMSVRSGLVTAAGVAVLSLLAPAGGVLDERAAHAQGKSRAVKEVESKTVAAMENFDLLEFETARKQLAEAVALARKNKLDRQPAVARAYLDLGIVEFAGLKDAEAAREAFAAAVAIDPDIEIGVAYRTPAMAELLKEVKKGPTPAAADDADAREEPAGDGCGAIPGIEHTPVDRGVIGQQQTISARVGDPVKAERVSLFYRAAEAARYIEVPMRRRAGSCAYVAAIPGTAMHGSAIHYYVAAVAGGQTVASKGSRTSPNIIELGAGDAAGEAASPSVERGRPAARGGKKKVFVSLAVGTGGGYVSGTTEVVGSEVDCCVALSPVHFFPEIGYYFTRRLSLSAAFRMGFALGANVAGHATAAPSGLLRLRFALSDSGEGFLLSVAGGGGIIRNTVKVEEAASGMNTDTTASGPFIGGAGLGYLKALSGATHLIAELNALAAFPGGIEELGPCPGSGCVRPNFGVEVDFNFGVLFAF
jgi:hypothetical protein